MRQGKRHITYDSTNQLVSAANAQTYAQEVEENSVSLGEINAKLLQKIEELTLHIIDLQKQIDELKQGKE